MSDVVERVTADIGKRLAQLRPVLVEYDRLRAAVAALDGIDGAPSTASKPTPSRGPGRPRAVTPVAEAAKPAASGRRARGRRRGGGRPKGGGARAAQALAAITKQPGITIPELAKKIGVNTTYLYRVVPGLVKEGKVVKDGRSYRPGA